MKYLIFSDSHLSSRFEPKKYKFLKKIVSSADRVIINGDFWEGYGWSFDEFISSKWNRLFPLLKKKKTVYLFGNHDKKGYSDKRASLFSSEQRIEYKFKSGNKTFYLEHGDRLAPLIDALFHKFPKPLNDSMDRIEWFLFKTLGKIHLYLFFRYLNRRIKKLIKGKYKKNEYLICGHTNYAEIDHKHNFLNSGFVKHGIGQYLTIENGEILHHEERY